jgi:hypothetical protein
MSPKRILRTAGTSAAAALLGGVLLVGLMAGPASASSLVSPDGNTTISTTGTVTPGTPYDSAQPIKVTVVANSTLASATLTGDGLSNGKYVLEECADPGATTANLPTTAAGCEALTNTAGSDPLWTSTGAITTTFTVFDLPDSNLGNGTLTGVCDVAPNTCVIGIFAASPQTNGVGNGNPHLYSAPFQVTAGDGGDDDATPGDGTPEVPLALLLPLLAAGLVGGGSYYEIRRRRKVAKAA